MAEISWIKLKTTMFDDEKIRLIQAVPESDAILVIWIRLLVLAGKTNDDGLIYIQRNMPYTEEMLATLFGKNVNTVRLALTTLASFHMIDLGQDGLMAITNWEKHQNIDGMEQVRLKNAERNRKYRERKKQLTIESDVSVTSRDGADIDIELDIEKEKEKDIKDIERPAPKKSKPKPVRHKYGEYQNVLLSDEQLTKLKTEFPNDWQARIERLSGYVASTGKSYKDHLATIRNWAKKDQQRPQQRQWDNPARPPEPLPEWVDKQMQETEMSAEDKRAFQERINNLKNTRG